MVREIAWLIVVATSCHSRAITFESEGRSCSGDFGDASDPCGPTACTFAGAWQEATVMGGTLPCSAGAFAFDEMGGVSQLTGSGWVAAGRYSTCGDRARSMELPRLLASRLPPGCGPACEVSIAGGSDAAQACLVRLDVPCDPTVVNGYRIGATTFYDPCTP